MRDQVRIVGRQTIYRGFGHLEEIVFRRRHSAGHMTNLNREVMDTGDSVVILPYDTLRGTIILIRQFRGVAFMREEREWIIEACAGKLDDADPVARVIAETEEETGLRLSGPPRLLFTAYTTPGSFAERLSYFVAPYSSEDRVSPGGGLAEEEEDIEVFETTLDDAIALIETGEIVDSKTILLLYYARATNLLAEKSR